MSLLTLPKEILYKILHCRRNWLLLSITSKALRQLIEQAPINDLIYTCNGILSSYDVFVESLAADKWDDNMYTTKMIGKRMWFSTDENTLMFLFDEQYTITNQLGEFIITIHPIYSFYKENLSQLALNHVYIVENIEYVIQLYRITLTEAAMILHNNIPSLRLYHTK